MTKITQEKVVSEYYFGNPIDPNSVGLSKQLVEGNDLSAHLYDTEEISLQTNRHQQSSNNCKIVTLRLKLCLHCILNTQVVVGTQPNNINLPLLISSGLVSPKSSITPQNVAFSCPRAHQEWEKALAVVVNKKSIQSVWLHRESSVGNEYR